jgi:hypothetical protein
MLRGQRGILILVGVLISSPRSGRCLHLLTGFLVDLLAGCLVTLSGFLVGVLGFFGAEDPSLPLLPFPGRLLTCGNLSVATGSGCWLLNTSPGLADWEYSTLAYTSLSLVLMFRMRQNWGLAEGEGAGDVMLRNRVLKHPALVD